MAWIAFTLALLHAISAAAIVSITDESAAATREDIERTSAQLPPAVASATKRTVTAAIATLEIATAACLLLLWTMTK